jgi:hypothetical protein
MRRGAPSIVSKSRRRYLAEAIREHAAEKAAHDAAVVVWYEGGAIGSRPAPSPSMLELERRIGELRQDVGASDNALEAANDALDAQKFGCRVPPNTP